MVEKKSSQTFAKTRKEKYNRNKLDHQKMQELKIFFEESLSDAGKTIWITENRCLKKIEFLPRYPSQKDRFPKVKEILDKYVESYEKFVKRKITWAIKNYGKNEIFSASTLRRKVGMPVNVLKKFQSYVMEEAQKHSVQVHTKSIFFKNIKKNWIALF